MHSVENHWNSNLGFVRINPGQRIGLAFTLHRILNPNLQGHIALGFENVGRESLVFPRRFQICDTSPSDWLARIWPIMMNFLHRITLKESHKSANYCGRRKILADQI